HSRDRIMLDRHGFTGRIDRSNQAFSVALLHDDKSSIGAGLRCFIFRTGQQKGRCKEQTAERFPGGHWMLFKESFDGSVNGSDPPAVRAMKANIGKRVQGRIRSNVIERKIDGQHGSYFEPRKIEKVSRAKP